MTCKVAPQTMPNSNVSRTNSYLYSASMTKERVIVGATIIGALAAIVVVPEVRDWTCENFGHLCKGQGDTAGAPKTPVTATVPAAAKPRSTQSTQVESTKSSRSFQSLQPTSITFVNTLDRPVAVLWRDFAGVEKLYMNLGPGQSYEQPTYTTHAWVVRESASGTIVLAIVGTERPQIAKIGRP